MGVGLLHLPQYAQTLRTTVLQHIGIPTCVGMAPTKVLAKAANRVAKKFKERTQGVWVLDTPEKTTKCLEWLPIEDVWGIGSRSMRVMDAVNQKYGTDFIRSGAFEPTGDWRLRRERLSPCYTTDWDQLLTIGHL